MVFLNVLLLSVCNKNKNIQTILNSMKSVSVLESGLFKVTAVCCLNFVFEHYSLEIYGILGIVQKTESSCQKRLENSGF